MRLTEQTLRAYLDGALSPTEMAQVKQHLSASAEAQAILARLRAERVDVAPYLDALAPSAAAQSPAPQAWRRFQASLAGQSNNQPLDRKERISQMFNNSSFKRYQPALITLTVIVVIAVSLSFAPVRAVAGNLLSVFRVQNIKLVPVDEAHLESMKNNPQIDGILDELEAQVNVISDGGEPESVDSLDEADKRVGFSVTRITALPDGLDDPTGIEVAGQKVIEFNLDKELLDALFEAAEIEVDLPDSLDEEPLIITQPDTVMQEWKQAEHRLGFVQMMSPSVVYPDDLDLNALGAAGLQLLGMSEEEAHKLAASIDWANTLILPVPRDNDLSVSEVSINGSQGFVFTGEDDDENAIMWTANNMTFFIAGNYPAGQLVEMAESVQ